MNYYDRALGADDLYYNPPITVRLPNDAVLDDPQKLEELSGKVETYFIGREEEARMG